MDRTDHSESHLDPTARHKTPPRAFGATRGAFCATRASRRQEQTNPRRYLPFHGSPVRRHPFTKRHTLWTMPVFLASGEGILAPRQPPCKHRKTHTHTHQLDPVLRRPSKWSSPGKAQEERERERERRHLPLLTLWSRLAGHIFNILVFGPPGCRICWAPWGASPTSWKRTEKQNVRLAIAGVSLGARHQPIRPPVLVQTLF